MRLPTQFRAKDVLASGNGILLKTEVETVSKHSTPGHWTIVTTSAEGADKLIPQNTLTIGPEREKYKLEPRVQRATLLTIPFVDLEISNTEIFDYFSQCGYVYKVTHEYFKETGQRPVFIRLAKGSSFKAQGSSRRLSVKRHLATPKSREKKFTFYSNVGTGSRLDRFYVTRTLTTDVIESKIDNFAHSDHSKITIKMDLSEIERGPGIWKINNSYLKDSKYIEQITHMWYQHQFKKTISDYINGWWDEGKKLIKEISTNFSKKKTKEKTQHKRNFLKQFRNIKNKLDRDPSNARSKDIYNKN